MGKTKQKTNGLVDSMSHSVDITVDEFIKGIISVAEIKNSDSDFIPYWYHRCMGMLRVYKEAIEMIPTDEKLNITEDDMLIALMQQGYFKCFR